MQPAVVCSRKTVLIKAASQGIGPAVAVAFVEAHAKGAVHLGRIQSTLENTAEELKKTSGGRTGSCIATDDSTDQPISTQLWIQQ